jgi:hypothetical protein
MTPPPCGPVRPRCRVTPSRGLIVTLFPHFCLVRYHTSYTEGSLHMKSEKGLVLSTSARSAIVSTFVDALNAAENTGSLVTQVCDTANKYTKGETIGDEDMSAIVGSIAKERGWKGPALKSRTSEVRVVLRASGQLPEAIKALSTKAGKCDWHASMKLARCINKGMAIPKAVKLCMATKEQSAKSTPQGRTAGALKAWFKIAKADKKAAILEAAKVLNIALGVKVDA